jgi:hypothetical protein
MENGKKCTMVGLGGKMVKGWKTERKHKLRYDGKIKKTKFIISVDARGISFVGAD